MSPLRLRAAAGIIAALVISVFLLSAPRAKDGAEVAVQGAPASVPTVTLRDTFKKGTYTITAMVTVPDACSAAEASVSQADESIVVAITIAPSEGLCLKVPSERRFTLVTAAPQGLPLKATVNGVPAPLAP